MFNNEFYPTPEPVIQLMLEPFIREYTDYRGFTNQVLTAKKVLEPSAGKGDILDFIKRSQTRTSLYAIELEPELRFILQGKGYTVLDSNFLNFQSEGHFFDLIVMNPPFSNGDEHLLKAWDVVGDDGDIVCLLNAETIRNPFSQKRKVLLNLIKQHGSYEFLGSVFDTAERKTGVDVALVRLKKPKAEFEPLFSDIHFDSLKDEQEFQFSANPLAHANIIESLVAQYDIARKILVEKNKLEKQYLFYVSEVQDTKYNEENLPKSLNDEIFELTARFWRYVFKRTKLSEIATSSFIKKFDEFTEQTEKLAFTVNNIEEVLLYVLGNQGQIMKECLLTTFDTATTFHAKNKVHVEGWKTNSTYKVNKKIILPYAVTYDGWWGWNYYARTRDFLLDIDKVLSWLTGNKGYISTYQAMDNRFTEIRRGDCSYRDVFESTFFKIRFFKKGTVHLTFKDDNVWEKFNVESAKGKMWIGDGE